VLRIALFACSAIVRSRGADPDGFRWGTIEIVTFAYILGILTASGDTFFTFHFPVTVRFAQLAFCVPIVAAAIRVIRTQRMQVPVGFGSLLLWACFIVLFIPNTRFVAFSVGYALWLLFNIALVLATVCLFTTPAYIRILLRWYILSFGLVSAFAIFQFLCPLVGVAPPLVTTWWIPGVFPRVAAFSYEPSYLATYLTLGWLFAAYLFEHKSALMTRGSLACILTLNTLGILVSTSRLGVAIMALWLARHPIRLLSGLVRANLRRRSLRVSLELALMTALAGGIVLHLGVENVSFLLAGLGALDQPAHSVVEREKRFSDTVKIFEASPVVGYSLGGINYAIARHNGEGIADYKTMQQFTGLSIFVEVLAASGLIGIIPFLYYVTTILYRPWALADRVSRETKILLQGAVLSLGGELIMLQFNQNILRLYLWVHIAVLSALYGCARHEWRRRPLFRA
jgi:hypothetical protein